MSAWNGEVSTESVGVAGGGHAQEVDVARDPGSDHLLADELDVRHPVPVSVFILALKNINI